MILQPIVENSILHGFGGPARGRTGRGTIRVVARREERALPLPAYPQPGVVALPDEVLIVEVRDDGAGMKPGARAEPSDRRGSSDSLHRIGISNVERRIALNFGAPYGMEIESAPGAFTLIRFVLPALVRSEATNEMSNEAADA
jgi:sensor histidine kinase YesM